MPKKKDAEVPVKKPVTIKIKEAPDAAPDAHDAAPDAHDAAPDAHDAAPDAPEPQEDIAPTPAETPAETPTQPVATDDPESLKTTLEAQRAEMNRLRTENETLNTRLANALAAPANAVVLETKDPKPCDKCKKLYLAAKELEADLVTHSLSDDVIDAVDAEVDNDELEDLDDRVLALLDILTAERKKLRLMRIKMNNLIDENNTLMDANDRLERQLHAVST